MVTRLRAFALLIPLVFSACKKKEQPAPPSSAAGAAAASAPGAAPVATAKGEGLAILKDFEGQVSWVAKGKLAGPSKGGGQQTLPLALLVKDGKFRLDLPAALAGAPPGDSAYLIGHPQQKKLYAVIDKQKQAVLIDADKLGTQIEAMSGKGAAGPAAGDDAPDVKKTGKLEQVAGYSCEVWQITHKTSKTEMCIAGEGTAWFQLPLTNLPAKYSWAAELTDGKHFPLRLVVFDRNGTEEGRVELSGIEKKKLEAANFEVPAGYQVIDLEQMMAGMMQGLSGMHGRPGSPSLQGLPKGLPSALVRSSPGSTAKPSASAKKR